jgi:hypothetical protein
MEITGATSERWPDRAFRLHLHRQPTAPRRRYPAVSCWRRLTVGMVQAQRYTAQLTPKLQDGAVHLRAPRKVLQFAAAYFFLIRVPRKLGSAIGTADKRAAV